MSRASPNRERAAVNPFKRGDYARRLPEYLHSGNWIGGDQVFRVKHIEKGFLTFAHARLKGDFYYGYFEKVLTQ